MLNNTAVYTKISFFSSLDVAHVLLTTSPYPSPLILIQVYPPGLLQFAPSGTRKDICALRPPHPRSRSTPSLSSLLHIVGSGYPFTMTPDPSPYLFITCSFFQGKTEFRYMVARASRSGLPGTYAASPLGLRFLDNHCSLLISRSHSIFIKLEV